MNVKKVATENIWVMPGYWGSVEGVGGGSVEGDGDVEGSEEGVMKVEGGIKG